jgi:chorismate-pyruvate lyase
MKKILQIADPYQVTLNDISKLEQASNTKFNIYEKVLLVNNGTTEQVLQVLLNTSTKIKVIRQNESNFIMKRESNIISNDKIKKVLATAISKIYVKRIPLEIINEIRLARIGIGMIMMKYQLETFKKILKIGYNSSKQNIFREYKLFHNYLNICDINETFLMRF